MAENKTFSHDPADHNGGLSVERKARDLADAITENREYREYTEAYNRLSPEEIEKLRSFKHTESLIPPGGRMNFEEEKRIGNLYTVLTLNKNIKAFIEKERAVCATLTHVFDIVGDIQLFMFE
ncbi:MAG: YlbF family regulator [Clostridiales bacterium]|jgi:cell fate (sporulation/competence/biofilm development) regulator YlbF (YheA/YmcA/DUF963 family)|nr:YlbF family regulator [Clostridiales bacterium]